MILALAALALASLACQALTGTRQEAGQGGGAPGAAATASNSQGDAPPASENSGGNSAGNPSDFPVTVDAFNFFDMGDGNLLYYTKLSQEEVMAFYRAEFTAQGYTERELLTVVSDGVFSMVFDGDPSGKAVVIQSVDLGDGSCTVSIRLEDI
jgi:hypothetical protein